MIETVLGAIKPEELGVCLPHEHVWCDQRLAPRAELFGLTRSTASYMRLDDFDRMVDELRAYRDAGGRALVEVTCDGWGRDLDVLARLSEAERGPHRRHGRVLHRAVPAATSSPSGRSSGLPTT